MSKRETSADENGWRRGQKGYAAGGQWDKDNGDSFSKGDYKKDLLEVKAVGQRAQVGSEAKEKQADY